jgi:hypothetical protein
MIEVFHSLCDNKGPTLSLFKVEGTGHCIGGYTKAEWSSSSKECTVADPDPVVFNLTKQTAFRVINKDKAITCGSHWGPVFTNTLWAN